MVNKNNQESSLDKNLKIIAKSSIIMFVGVFLSKIFIYLYRILIARNFGPEGYGIFSLAIIIIAWFTVVSALGINEGLLRYFSYYRGKNKIEYSRHLFKYSVIILTITSIIAGLLLYFSAEYISINFFKNLELILFLKFFSIVIPLTVISYPFLVALKSYNFFKEYSLVFNIIQNILKLILIIVFLYFGLQLNAVILSYLFSIVGFFIFSIYFARKLIPDLFQSVKIDLATRKKLNKDLVFYSLPLLFAGIVNNILFWADSFLIGYFKGVSEVGIYSASMSLAQLLLIAAVVFMDLFLPIINLEYGKKNYKVINQLSKQVAKWIFLINIPVFTLIILFPGTLLNLLFGPEFLAGEMSLRILSIGFLFFSVSIISRQLILMSGKSKTFFVDTLVAVIVNIILNIIFIPMDNILFIDNELGINGAAFATSFSIIFLSLLFFIQGKSSTKSLPLKRKMITIFIISIFSIIVMSFFKSIIPINLFTVILLSGLFILIYVIMNLLTKSLDENDWLIINSIKRRIFPS